jgi:hypothetical protein
MGFKDDFSLQKLNFKSGDVFHTKIDFSCKKSTLKAKKIAAGTSVGILSV